MHLFCFLVGECSEVCRKCLWAGLVAVAVLQGVADAAVDWPTLRVASVVALPTNEAVGGVAARDGSGRLFIPARNGVVYVRSGVGFLPTPFIDISERTVVPGPFGESGLLGLVFSPDYATSGRFYLHYNRRSDRANVVSRFTVSATNPDLADAGSEEVLLVVPQANDYHKGGDLAFGPDGYLYISLGDDDQSTVSSLNPAQILDTLPGKILRIDVSSPAPQGQSYAIPATNPYAAATGDVRKEIWALGLRNPWRISFDRANGDIYIADVGENTREEINVRPAGGGGAVNYGWPIREGSVAHGGNPNPNPGALTEPVFDYGRDLGGSVIGGYVYRGPAGRMTGMYLFSDYISRRIWGLRSDGGVWRAEVLGTVPAAPVAFAEEEDGSLQVVTAAGLYRLSDSGAVHAPVLRRLTIESSNPVPVQVTTLTPGARLYYTLDGSTPDISSSEVPENGIVIVDAGQTLRVVAIRADLTPAESAPLSMNFAAGSPSIRLLGRNVAYGHLVEVTSVTNQAMYHHTLNGDAPTTASAPTDGRLLMKNGAFLQVLAAREGYESSQVVFALEPATDHESSEVSTLAGSGEAGMLDGAAAGARFNSPTGIVWTPQNRLYVTDFTTTESRIREIDLAAGIVSTLCGSAVGDVDGSLANARFGNSLSSIAWNPGDGCLYVADKQNRKIRRIDVANGTVSTVVTGTGSSLADVYIAASGRLYWSENAGIWTRNETTGVPFRFAGSGVNNTAGFSFVVAMCAGDDDELFALSRGVHRVSVSGALSFYISEQLSPSSLGDVDGPLRNGRVAAASGEMIDIIRDSAGAIYATSGSAIRKIIPGHGVRTLAGRATYSSATRFLDGPGNLARFGLSVRGLAVDDEGRVYVADTSNRRVRMIRQADWDADGVPDSVETMGPYMQGLNDAFLDDDGDHLSNTMEYLTGTNPEDANSALRPAIVVVDGTHTLTWPSREGVVYLVEKSTDLQMWTPEPDSIVEGTGEMLEWSHGPGAAGETRIFFRVVPFAKVP